MFKSAFFIVYMAQSVIDLLGYLSCAISVRVAPYDASFHASQLGKLISLLSPYVMCFQFTAHVIIAFNRYTAFLNPTRHRQIWSARRLCGIMLILFTLPVVGAVFRALSEIKLVQLDNATVVTWTPMWMYAANSTVISIYAVTASALCGYFELRTLVAYRRMSENSKRENKEDYRLLIYAVTQFVGQTLMTTYGLCILIAYVTESIALVRAAHYSLSYIIDIQSLSGPICLFLMSKDVRMNFARLYGCQRLWPSHKVTTVSQDPRSLC